MAVDVDQLDITKRLVYGTSTPGSDPNTHIRDDLKTSIPPSLNIVMSDYLETGAGRYALPSRAPIVDAFFNDVLVGNGIFRQLEDGQYTLPELITELGLSPADSRTNFVVFQYNTGGNSTDFIERSYIFGSTPFHLEPDMIFDVNGLNYSINNLEVIADKDNFDFQSTNDIAIRANEFLRESLDPYGLIPEVEGKTVPVDINFTGEGRTYSDYGFLDYLADQTSDIANVFTLPDAAVQFGIALAGLKTNLGYLGSINADNRFRYITDDGKKIVYGTPDSDTLTPNSAETEDSGSGGFQLVGGDGTDQITGGTEADELWGGTENDTLQGEGGNDELFGGAGIGDMAVFSGDCLDYNISGGNGTATITHARGSMSDGTDTLVDVEIARFSDGKEIDLTQSTLFGCTSIEFIQDFVTGTTLDTAIVFDLDRLGDTSYPINVFVDGRVTTGNAVFNDFFYTIQPGESPELVIGASVAEVFGDVAFDFEISINVVDPLFSFVEITDGTAGGVLIGDQVDNRGGRTFGDPHFITFDNVGYDFQAAGEFVLARATSGTAYEVQARFRALSSAVSVTEAVATTLGSTVVSIEAGADNALLRLNGVATELSDGESIIAGTGTITRAGRQITIDHGGGDQTLVDVFSSFLNVTPSPSLARDRGTIEGLFGDADGNPSNDFRLADGTILSTPLSIETLYGAYAQSWLVAPEASLLPGEPLAYEAPDRIVTVDSLPEALREAAEAAVDAAGITNEVVREAAILDFALTSNQEFIEAAKLTDNAFDPIVGTVAVDPINDPVVVLTSNRIELNEEDAAARTATLTISRGSSEGALTVSYSATGTGTAPADASDFAGGFPSGEIVLRDGEDTATFDIEIANDSLAEGSEAFDIVIALNDTLPTSFELLVSSVRFSIEDGDYETRPNEVIGTNDRDNLVGTSGNDVVRGLGGPLDVLSGGGGSDDFDFTGLAGNGSRDVTRILDYTPGIDRLVGLSSEDVLRSFVRGNSTTLVLEGDDSDQVIITGIARLEDITFASSSLLIA